MRIGTYGATSPTVGTIAHRIDLTAIRIDGIAIRITGITSGQRTRPSSTALRSIREVTSHAATTTVGNSIDVGLTPIGRVTVAI